MTDKEKRNHEIAIKYEAYKKAQALKDMKEATAEENKRRSLKVSTMKGPPTNG